VILAEYFEIWIIESNGYCLNCSESQSSGPGRTNLYGIQYYQNSRISHFARCGLTDRSVAIQILTLLMWQNFNTKQGTQKKTGQYGNPEHIFY
jgi:hypothetical protein